MFKLQQHQLESLRAAVNKQAPQRLQKALEKRGLDAVLSPDQSFCQVSGTGGLPTTLHFAATGLPTALELPAGSRYELECHADGKLKTLQYPSGDRVAFTFNAQDRIASVGRGKAQYRLEYDDAARPISVQYPDGSSRTHRFDDHGRLSAVTDRMGAETSYHWQHALEFSRQDALGRRLKVELEADAGTGDPAGLKALHFPDGSQETFQIGNGERSAVQPCRLLVRRDQSVVRLEADSHDRLSKMVYGTGWEVEYSYTDRLPQRIERITPRGSISVEFQYDKAGNVLSEQGPWGTVKARYDQEGRCIERQGSDGQTLTFAYDAEGRLTALLTPSGQCLSIQHQPSGHSLLYPNGVVERWEHERPATDRDHDQRDVAPSLKQSLFYADGRPLAQLEYHYDALDRLLERQERWGSGAEYAEARRFRYDAEHRLLEVVRKGDGATLESFQYDAVGNLVQDGGIPRTFGPMDELLGIGDQTLTTDALGHATRIPSSKGELLLTHGPDNTLTEVVSAGRTWHYRYDGLGRRVEKTDGQSTWRFGWFGHQLLWEQWQDSPNEPWQRRDYLWLPEGISPLGFMEAGRTFWLVQDARGAIIRAMDDQGLLVWRGSYSSFGEVAEEGAWVRQPWRLAGMYEDGETGLHITLARAYSPTLKTWLSLDPHWMMEGATHYSYARQDPWNRVDPTGQIAPLLIIGGAALVGGVIGAGVALATGGNPVSGFAGGAVTGAASAAAGCLLAAGAITAGVAFGLGLAASALGAVAEELTNQLMGEDPFCFKCLIQAIATAVITDLALLGLGKIPGVKKLAHAVGDTLAGWMSKWPLTKKLLKGASGSSHPQGARGSAVDWPGFDEKLAGGPVRKLSADGVKITSKGVDVVESHVSRFGSDKPNEVMVSRLKKIASGELEPTKQDMLFYTHELREYVRYRKLGWKTGVPGDSDAARNLWLQTHTATLADYGLPLKSDDLLYHPDAQRYFHE